MTSLHKVVRRLTKSEYKGRKLVIELRPSAVGAVVFVREAGRRTGYTVPLDFIYKAGAYLEAQARRKAKAQRKRAR